jgi:hypothetical protein
MEATLKRLLSWRMDASIWRDRGEQVGDAVQDDILTQPEVVYSAVDWDARRARLGASFGTYEGPIWDTVARAIEQER